jgi:predicted nucleic acid-binding protein
VRIIANPSYSPSAERPAKVAERLRAFCGSGYHEFWPDDVSLRDAGRFDLAVGHRKLTDVYLLALAVAHEGRLATFDRSIPLSGVPAAGPKHLAVIDA